MKQTHTPRSKKIYLLGILAIIVVISATISSIIKREQSDQGKEAFLNDGVMSSASIQKTPSPTPKSEEEIIEEKVQKEILAMKLEDKVSQLFMVAPEALAESAEIEATVELQQALTQYHVSGIVYFNKNLVSPEQLKKITADTQKYAQETQNIPLLLAVDEEGGSVARIANHDKFSVKKLPDMVIIGTSGDKKEAYEVGSTIGSYLHEYGLNLDFAPVADVLTNPENTIVEDRSFGSNPKVVTEMALQVSEGLKSQKVLSCFKHFPGHGAVAEDTHEGFAVTQKSWEELRKSEIVPFQRAVEEKIPFLMVSHIEAPNVTGDNVPASLSFRMMTELLRDEMGYEGIIITDSMQMKAITNQYDSASAAVKAIQAGADIVLMPQNFLEAYQGVLQAIKEGAITQERINQSLQRILAVRLGLGK
ncbi:glycoside hydrolase family 3 protein [Scatolibacter rhodanostii]|uniref:glycoside hydrolase family 3 protein n=1 Tax=Scatolibacter rhodanostii TaxID=2014781 RepID=UPI000C074EA4|nr:glycoside hydrolase family 3 protein [Scatolibacter rhodanostii]